MRHPERQRRLDLPHHLLSLRSHYLCLGTQCLGCREWLLLRYLPQKAYLLTLQNLCPHAHHYHKNRQCLLRIYSYFPGRQPPQGCLRRHLLRRLHYNSYPAHRRPLHPQLAKSQSCTQR